MENFRSKAKKEQRVLSKDLINKIPYRIWDEFLNYNDLRMCVTVLALPIDDLSRQGSLKTLSNYEFTSRKVLKKLNPDAFKVYKPSHQEISNIWSAQRFQKLILKYGLDVPIESIKNTVQLYSLQIHEIQEILALNE